MNAYLLIGGVLHFLVWNLYFIILEQGYSWGVFVISLIAFVPSAIVGEIANMMTGDDRRLYRRSFLGRRFERSFIAFCLLSSILTASISIYIGMSHGSSLFTLFLLGSLILISLLIVVVQIFVLFRLKK